MNTKTKYSILIGLVGTFFLIELAVGIFAQSLSLQTDAFHMLSDLIALIIGLTAHILAQRERTHNYTYGWIRAEIIGGLINSVFLLALSFSIVLEIIEKAIEIITEQTLENPQLATEIDLVLITAGLGLLINLIALFLFRDTHHHHHDHKSQHDIENPDEEDSAMTDDELIEESLNLNDHAVLLHVLGDTLASVVVIISSLLIKYLESEWRFLLDPIASLMIVIFISVSSFKLLKKTILILLHRSPEAIQESIIIGKIKELHGVTEIHEFHLWPLTNTINIATLHVQLNFGLIEQTDQIIQEINKIFHRHNIHSSTIQPEFSEDCLEHQCQNNCQNLKCCD